VLIIPQWRTEQLLRQRLAELGGRVQRGTEATGLVQDAASVTATLVRAGVTERVRAGWLVGCEGGHSVIRKLLGVGSRTRRGRSS
jgi:2-polyprenyl-6-methoxyphenol hydroxylase-like FAD-dependent oxidoreductase